MPSRVVGGGMGARGWGGRRYGGELTLGGPPWAFSGVNTDCAEELSARPSNPAGPLASSGEP